MTLEELLSKGDGYISVDTSVSTKDGSRLLFISVHDKDDGRHSMELRVKGDEIEVIGAESKKDDGESELANTEIS